MEAEMKIDVRTVRDCSDAEYKKMLADGWWDDFCQFMPDGKLNIVFKRRIVPEPVKTTVVQAAALAEKGELAGLLARWSAVVSEAFGGWYEMVEAYIQQVDEEGRQ